MPSHVPGTVVSLHLCAAAGEPMVTVEEARAVAGRGLDGDRYFTGTGFYSNKPGPDRELTLIEIETIDALRHELGIVLDAGAARRNVVTSGIRLNDLVGCEFRVGPVVARGMRLCEPCAHLAELTDKRTLKALVGRGGLRAEIVTGGTIRISDAVLPGSA